MKKNFICLIVLFFVFNAFGAEKKNKKEEPVYKEQCYSAKEYVTTLNFLRDPDNQFRAKENDARKVALFVSQGCKNASQRFIKIVKLLTKVGIDSATAIKTGKDFVHESNEKVDTFITIFKGTFLKNYLDMDLFSAKRIALSLSTGLQKDPKIVRKDFINISEFCVENDTLDLPKPKCGQYAIKIIKAADQFEGPISDAMIDLFEFMTKDKKGPNLATFKALELTENVLKYGPMAKKNFETGYSYALSKKGLKVSRAEAIKFGLQMAKFSSKKIENIAK